MANQIESRIIEELLKVLSLIEPEGLRNTSGVAECGYEGRVGTVA